MRYKTNLRNVSSVQAYYNVKDMKTSEGLIVDTCISKKYVLNLKNGNSYEITSYSENGDTLEFEADIQDFTEA